MLLAWSRRTAPSLCRCVAQGEPLTLPQLVSIFRVAQDHQAGLLLPQDCLWTASSSPLRRLPPCAPSQHSDACRPHFAPDATPLSPPSPSVTWNSVSSRAVHGGQQSPSPRPPHPHTHLQQQQQHSPQNPAFQEELVEHRAHPSSPHPSAQRQALAAPGAAGSAAGTAGAGEAPAPPPPSWVDTRLPSSWAPYAHLMRLDKPIGTWLLAWPCFWSIALAAPPASPPHLPTLALFGAGAVLLRGAGCTVNDLWDRELDKKVERTRRRPLAAGTITPTQAVAFLGAQLLAGLGVLLQLNPYSQALGASSLALVGTYPLMKRVTGWPQAYLGLTFNWGALLGWAAVRGACDWGIVLPLYGAGVCWTLVYDSIYAHQDKVDDAKVGIKSTALTWGGGTKRFLAAFSAANLGLLSLAGGMAGCGAPFYAGVAAGGLHLAWQVSSVDLDSRAQCWAKFSSNKWYGALVFGGIVADRLLAAPV